MELLKELSSDIEGIKIQGFETTKVLQSGTSPIDFSDYVAICPQVDVELTVTIGGEAQTAFTLSAGAIRVCTKWELVTCTADTLLELM